jgi:hypothetical protein
MSFMSSAARVQQPVKVIDLEIGKIVVPPKRRRSFSKDDEKIQHFLQSVRQTGILQPIEVREVAEGKYEIVFGLKRLWAAKQLELRTIPARIADWTDDQVAFVAVVENTQRGHLSAPQYVKQFQLLLREFEHHFGPDLGKRASGLAGARSVAKDPRTKQFVPTEGAGPESAEILGGEPLNDAVSLSGPEDKSEAAPRSHSALIGEVVGKHKDRVRDDIRLARAFTEAQLDELEGCDHVPNKEDLLRIAAIEDPETRSDCVNVVCAGLAVDDAIEQVADMKADPEDEVARKKVAEDKLPDDQWLNSYCFEARSRLQDPAIFDRAALAYRHDRPQRNVHKARSRDLVLKARKAGYDPFTQMLAHIFWVEHPGSWLMCHACQGKNRDNPACRECRGCGFKMQFDYPPDRKR